MNLERMSEVNENTLDRHFVSQLRIMSDVYSHNISKSDFVISQRWLQVFHKANRRDKYARNCLMLLMYGQLREMGKLGMPFIKMENVDRSLEEVLSDYQGNLAMEEELKQEQEQEQEQERELKRNQQEMKQPKELCKHQQQMLLENAKLEMIPEELDLPDLQLDNDDGISVVTTNLSSYNDSLPPHERLGGGSQCIDYVDHNFELLTQQNQQLIQEINQMHARTLENEQLYRQADSHWQQRIQAGHLPLPKSRMQWLLRRIDRGTQLAIRQLKGWATNSGPLNFLCISLQHILDDDPETLKHLSELDRKLEAVLDNLLEQAGERRERNVRMLYDQLFKQQQEALNSKQQLLQHEQRALMQARQQLQVHVQDLKQREEIFWEQASSSPYYSNLSRTNSNNKAETMRSTKTQTNRETYDAGSNSGSDICGCSDCQPELEQLRNLANEIESCDKPSCQYCQSQGPKDCVSSTKC